MKNFVTNVNTIVDERIIESLIYSCGVYTSFLISKGEVVGLQYHFDRVIDNAKNFLNVEVSKNELKETLRKFLSANDCLDMSCKISIFPCDFILGIPEKKKKPIIIISSGAKSSLSGLPLKIGISEFNRDFPEIKYTSIGSAIKARSEVRLQGYDDALFSNDSRITEGVTWNVFFISGSRIVTPKVKDCLPGVTRKVILDILPIMEDDIDIESLSSYEAAFATNAAIGAVPIQSINNIDLNPDNNLIKKVQKEYKEYSRLNFKDFIG